MVLPSEEWQAICFSSVSSCFLAVLSEVAIHPGNSKALCVCQEWRSSLEGWRGSSPAPKPKCAQMPLLDTYDCVGFKPGSEARALSVIESFLLAASVRKEHHLWELWFLSLLTVAEFQTLAGSNSLPCAIFSVTIYWGISQFDTSFCYAHKLLLSKGLILAMLLFRLNYFDVLHEQMLPWNLVWQPVIIIYHF